jgi:hypothetical protein
MDWCAPWKIANRADNLFFQALQFEEMDVCHKFLGGTSISHYRPNESFVEVQFNVNT